MDNNCFQESLLLYNELYNIEFQYTTSTSTDDGYLKTIMTITYWEVSTDFSGSFACGANFDKPSAKMYQSESSDLTVLCKQNVFLYFFCHDTKVISAKYLINYLILNSSSP